MWNKTQSDANKVLINENLYNDDADWWQIAANISAMPVSSKLMENI